MYNTFAELANAILTEVHQLEPQIQNDNDMALHIANITGNANRCLRRIWGLRDWTFKYVDNIPIIVPAESHVSEPLPFDWVNEGRQGGLWTDFDPRYQVKWARSGAVKNKIHTAPDETGTPLWYSVVGVPVPTTQPGPEVAPPHRPLKLIVFPKNTSAQNFSASYEVGTPILSYTLETDPESGLTLPDPIEALPFQWRHVLYEWTAAREMKDAGDLGQFGEQMREVQEALFDMVSGEAQGKPGTEMMSPYAGAPVEVDWMDW